MIPGQYCAVLRESLERAHEIARTKLRSVVQIRKRDYDLKAHERSYEVGDKVYILKTTVRPGKGRKLRSPWKGPAVIIRKITPYLYQVVHNRTTYVVNHDRLKLCKDGSPVPSSTLRGKGRDKYCICRRGNDGNFMIQCDFCLDWFHGRCVKVTPEEGEALSKYKCPLCTFQAS